jgi:prolyl-tRNA synthetase
LLIGESKKTLRTFGEKVYQGLVKTSLEVLYDDRDGVSAGEKFIDADLVGVPWRLVVSEKTLLNRKVEIKERSEKKTELLTLEQIIKKIRRES